MKKINNVEIRLGGLLTFKDEKYKIQTIGGIEDNVHLGLVSKEFKDEVLISGDQLVEITEADHQEFISPCRYSEYYK